MATAAATPENNAEHEPELEASPYSFRARWANQIANTIFTHVRDRRQDPEHRWPVNIRVQPDSGHLVIAEQLFGLDIREQGAVVTRRDIILHFTDVLITGVQVQYYKPGPRSSYAPLRTVSAVGANNDQFLRALSGEPCGEDEQPLSEEQQVEIVGAMRRVGIQLGIPPSEFEPAAHLVEERDALQAKAAAEAATLTQTPVAEAA
jgi:hypothetical protein